MMDPGSTDTPDSTDTAPDHSAAGPRPSNVGKWENEGGAMHDEATPGETSTDAAAAKAEPDMRGIIVESRPHYRVGPYSYGSLDDAVAERDRQERADASRAA